MQSSAANKSLVGSATSHNNAGRRGEMEMDKTSVLSADSEIEFYLKLEVKLSRGRSSSTVAMGVRAGPVTYVSLEQSSQLPTK